MVCLKVKSLDVLLKKVAQRSADQKNYILVFYGSYFSEELRDLVYQRERHAAFYIHADASAKGIHSLPYRVNNCIIYLVHNSEQEY
jgi:hypothetical protein